MVAHIVEYGKPMPRWCLGIRSVGPVLRQYPGVITPGHHLCRIGLTGSRIGIAPEAGIAAVGQIIKIMVSRYRLRIRLYVADGAG